ncbi:hypothetical protein NX907_16845 [Burkholderia thailandensis]|uniref:hypothetical protein n=1 Tax=Burkholderia thailandensis TaxID=57975 RepID=UPI00217DA48E|nr:hypothetical protein [Burkholderia thailandensis]MCS6507272.1 hypothetical protein [Burkholderia thailandensis]
MSNTLVSVIKMARPRRALFTTFTFSLSWFEALVLPALRQGNCEQIDVLVDARQACKSTDEAASLYAGSAYRVIPVYMEKTTVFHPKLAYLEGWEDLDHLVVASANLTMSGHGRNLEVIDALSSDTEPAVFGEFGDFLQALTAKYSFSAESLDVLHAYRRRAATQLARAGTVDEAARRTWLVHTLATPADEQFLDHAARIDDAHRLTVLSPFHAPSGAPVQKLAREIGVDTLRIGLDARSLIAPFTDEDVFDTQPDYVIAKREDEDPRPLHAKCFELEGSNGTLVMTGSVNATGQSLSSTDNVEVSLIRMLPKSPFKWAKATPVEFTPCEFKVDAMTARNPAIQVTWTIANQLVGHIEPAGDTELVTLSIWDGDERAALVDEVRLENGKFSVNMGQPVNARGALRLIVEGLDLHAEGWINVELDLAGDENQRKLAKASSRVMANEFRLEDLDTIFGWLSRLQNHVQSQEKREPGGASRTSPSTRSGTAPAPVRKMSYDEWRASIEAPHVAKTPAGLTRNTVEAVLRWLNRDLTAQSPTAAPEKGDTPPSESMPTGRASPPVKRALLATEKSEFTSGGSSADEERRQRTEALYQALLEAIPKGLALEARSSVAPMLVELSGAAQLKHALVQGARGGHGADHLALMLQGWLTRFATFEYGEDNRGVLLPFFSAMACCAVAAHSQVSLPSLKEALELLAGRSLEPGEIAAGARLALRTNRFDRILEDMKRAALEVAGAIEAEQTQSQRLVSLIEQFTSPATKSAPKVPPRYQKAFEALWQHRKSTRGSFGVLARSMGPMACPCCYGRLQTEDASRLRADQVCLCLNCRRPLFYALDTAALDQNGLAGRYKKN